jgi:hypothetical protein
MLPSIVNDTELLYRAITIYPHLWKNELNKPSSAAFKDSKGVSVDRDGQRDETEIIKILKDRFDLKAIVKLETAFCRNIGARVLAKPTKENIFHAEIHDAEKISLSASKAKKLARECEIVFNNN